MRDKYAERIVRLEILQLETLQGFVMAAENQGLDIPRSVQDKIVEIRSDVDRYEETGIF